MKILKTLLFGLLLLIIITFSMKNAGYVRLGYFSVIHQFEIPLFLLVLLSILFGMFMGAVVDLIKRHRVKKGIRRRQKVMDELQKELRSLRSLIFSGPKDGRGKEA